MELRSVDIAATIAYGVMFDPKNSEKVQSMDFNRLRTSVGNLFDLLEQRQIDYVLVGGIAMLAYVEGRNTQDVGLILSREDVSKLPELTIEDENQDFLRGKFGELQVDVLLTGKGLFSKVAKQHSTTQNFAGQRVRCATPEGLAILKLFALPSLYRQGQFARVRIYEGDVEALLETAKLDPRGLIEELKGELIESDLDEIAKILGDLQCRMEAKRSKFGGGSSDPSR